MTDIRAPLAEIAAVLAPMCNHISVRDGEHGQFIFAIGEDGVHSLELRQIDGEFILELWQGKTAEAERLVEEVRISDAASAVARSEAWLQAGIPR